MHIDEVLQTKILEKTTSYFGWWRMHVAKALADTLSILVDNDGIAEHKIMFWVLPQLLHLHRKFLRHPQVVGIAKGDEVAFCHLQS
ncbi:MAG TPA: hypothetical protein VEC99_10205, partial [Clostridia bacterium]|nr:hypothetical protein [Clostridia bacterium]